MAEHDRASSHDIIVVGASAGGVETLRTLVAALPPDLPASLMVVLHVSPRSPAVLAALLARAGPLPAETATDKAKIEKGRIYVAPPDRHLLVHRQHLRVVRGPRENSHRPAVDVLFRSAAWAYGPQVVAVVLSGTLDDGTAGLWAVRTCGGVCVVQDPEDALYGEMPRNALQTFQVDHCVALRDIPPLLVDLAHRPVAARMQHPPANIKTEVEFAMMEHDIRDMDTLGKPSGFTCPNCNGSLWELHDGELVRYRCHVGHSFSPESLLAEQSAAVEQALYSAVRALEEKAAIWRRMADRYAVSHPSWSGEYTAKAAELDESADHIRRVLRRTGV